MRELTTAFLLMHVFTPMHVGGTTTIDGVRHVFACMSSFFGMTSILPLVANPWVGTALPLKNENRFLATLASPFRWKFERTILPIYVPIPYLLLIPLVISIPLSLRLVTAPRNPLNLATTTLSFRPPQLPDCTLPAPMALTGDGAYLLLRLLL